LAANSISLAFHDSLSRFSLSPLWLPQLTPSFVVPGGPLCPNLPPLWSVALISHTLLGYGFWGQRIEWRYLRFEQIQDGGHRHVGKISSGDISATGRPTSCFVLGWGLRGRRV